MQGCKDETINDFGVCVACDYKYGGTDCEQLRAVFDMKVIRGLKPRHLIKFRRALERGAEN